MLGSGDSVLVLMHVTYLAHLLTVYNHTILTVLHSEKVRPKKPLVRPLALSLPPILVRSKDMRALGGRAWE